MLVPIASLRVRRDLDRLLRRDARLMAFVAPAGYGKSALAREYANSFPAQVLVTCENRQTARSLLSAISDGIERRANDDSNPRSVLTPSTCIVIDAAERISESVLCEVLGTLLVQRPPSDRIVITTRIVPATPLETIFGKHQTAVFTKRDFAWTLSDLYRLEERFSPEPILQMFMAQFLTRGWPLAGRFLLDRETVAVHGWWRRFVPEDLLEWIDREIFAELDGELRDALFQATVCTDIRDSDFGDIFLRRGCERLVNERQLADTGFGKEISVPPLLQLYVRARHPQECRRIADVLAERFLKSGERVRACRILLNDGQLERAEQLVVEMSAAERYAMCEFPYPGILNEIFRSLERPLTDFPMLWVSLLPNRRYLRAPSELAREAESVSTRKPGEQERPPNDFVTMIRIWLLSEAGAVDEAERLAETMGAATEAYHGTLPAALMALDIARGRFQAAIEHFRESAAAATHHGIWYAMLLRMLIRAYVSLGDFEAGRDAWRAMLALPAVARSPYVAVAGADESTFFAWLQGNDDALYRHRDMFGRLTLEYDVPGFWNVLAAFHGWPVQLTLSLDPINESRAALVLAADAPNDPAVAAARARRAVESADRASFALTQVKSRAVAAVLVPEAAQTFCEEAVAIAEKTDSPILRQAASAIAQGTPDATQHIQMIRLIGRVANDRGRQLPNKTLLLDLTTGEVTGAAGPIHLSSGALSLIVSLGVHAEPVSRAVLLESLWPDLDGDSASNALKMCVRRARAQLGGVDTVVNRLAGYALGERVHSNFQRIVALASMAYAGTFPEKTAMEAEHVFRRLIAGHRSAWARWEWFAPYARRLEDACRAIGYRLANDAIAGKDFVRALRIARDLIALEPLDEKPRQIAIQSLIGLKDRAAARREFEEFAALAEREGFSLSPQLRERAGS